MRAVPNNEDTANKIIEFFEKPFFERKKIGFETKQNFLKNFQWDISGSQWEKYFDSVDIRPDEETWFSKPDIKNIPRPPSQEDLENLRDEYLMSKILILNVLQKPNLINSDLMFRLQKDLSCGFITEASAGGGYYSNDSSFLDNGLRSKRIEFNFMKAYELMANQRHIINELEKKRMEKFNLK